MSRLNTPGELEVWQKTTTLLEHSYKLSSFFPQEEFFALTMRLRQTAAAIAGNLCEGGLMPAPSRVVSLQEVLKNIAEVRQNMTLAHDLNYVDADGVAFIELQCSHIALLTRKLIYTLKQR